MARLNPTTPLLTAEAMREADRYTMEDYGIPGFTLMESAGRGAAAAIRERYGPDLQDASVVVLCGKGNNGGDGLVVARRLFAMGARIHVVLMSEAEALRDDPARNLSLLQHLHAHHPDAGRLTLRSFESLEKLDAATAPLAPDLYVDALLGTGLTSDLREPIRSVVDWLNDRSAPVVALDVPSGLHSDTGRILGDAVRAACTVTMAAPKVGLRLGEGPVVAGSVEVVEIGIPSFVIDRVAKRAGCVRATTDAAVRAWWPARAHNAYKYSAGTVLVVGGAPSYTGAPVMAAKAAARSGAGYVMCACPASVQSALAGSMTTIPTLGLPTTDAGTIDPGPALDALADRLDTADALLVGPGLGRAAPTVRFVRTLLRETDLPTVIDADGLNALAGSIDDLTDHANGRWLLTPHAGEFNRLAGSVDLDDRVRAADTYAARWNSTLLLKGRPSLVAQPSGTTYAGSTGTEALATAGTGDVLAGQCAALLAQGVAPARAAACALHLGGAAAERYDQQHDARTMVATDLLDMLPAAARTCLEATDL
jgi:NAD(P)H-hydrate epimerase